LTGAAERTHPWAVDVVASPDVVEFVRSRGGVLYVWTVTMEYGYHPVFVLEASVESPGVTYTFHRFQGEGIELLLDVGGRDLPESVQLDVSGLLRKRIRATWNGNSFTLA
jgi:hypothetical protein